MDSRKRKTRDSNEGISPSRSTRRKAFVVPIHVTFRHLHLIDESIALGQNRR